MAGSERAAVCCSVLQCIAVCCSVLQCVAVCCSVLQCAADIFNVYNMPDSNVWRDMFMCLTWLIQVWRDLFIGVTWLDHTCAVPHSYVCWETFVCAPWLMYTRAVTHSYVYPDYTINCQIYRALFNENVYITLQHTATHCNTLQPLQHTATHCNTLHHNAGLFW